jgi:hypothetical protein
MLDGQTSCLGKKPSPIKLTAWTESERIHLLIELLSEGVPGAAIPLIDGSTWFTH